ncbi:MAG: hypothetical protein IH988_10410 [Planctomycetes bacterium]|nr:hypothetical protein [Planctomycetota bacterium]
MVTIRDIDAGVHNAFVTLNDDDDSGDGEMEVTAVAPDGPDGSGPIYFRDSFTLPADVSWDSGNEFVSFMHTSEHDEITNWGGDGTEDTFVLDTFTVTHDGSSTEGTVLLTFETGARAPQICTGDLVCYVYGIGFDGVLPNFLDPGVGAEDNPFIINLVPAPECEGDANGDGTVDPLDSGFVLARFGTCD